MYNEGVKINTNVQNEILFLKGLSHQFEFGKKWFSWKEQK
jgi:hypothetical protein